MECSYRLGEVLGFSFYAGGPPFFFSEKLGLIEGVGNKNSFFLKGGGGTDFWSSSSFFLVWPGGLYLGCPFILIITIKRKILRIIYRCE